METKQLIPVEKNVEIEKEGTVVPGTFDKGKLRLHFKDVFNLIFSY